MDIIIVHYPLVQERTTTENRTWNKNGEEKENKTWAKKEKKKKVKKNHDTVEAA
jgi:hypothetical protein